MRILAFAYACDPVEGSEPGAGWMWSRMLARLGETWVITRANNRSAIEAGLASIPERDRLHFVYVDLPPWTRFWKRGTRGLRTYYVLWQLQALWVGRRLRRRVGIDLVWHLTIANAWIGTTAPLVGGPFVLGPVGGGVSAPWRLVPALGARWMVFELCRAIAQIAGRYLNPLARLAWNRADLILVQNAETLEWLPRRHRGKARVFPHAVLASLSAVRRTSTEQTLPTAMFAGRLLGWKGVGLAIEVIARAPEWRLLVCGQGPDEGRLRKLAATLGVQDRVAFVGKVPRAEVQRRMLNEATVFLFPSLHDDAPCVPVEALAAELPVVCLDRGGVPLLSGGYGIAVPVAGGIEEVISGLASAMRLARKMSMRGARAQADQYCIDRRFEQLRKLLDLTSVSPEFHDGDRSAAVVLPRELL